jgi:lipopolysaccharide heptosyltransferase II
MKILIIQQKMIGDVLTTSILFEALKQKYPNSKLHYLINSHTFPVVENNPFIDQFIFFSPEIEKSKLKFFQFLKSVRKEKYDVVVDVYSKLSSNIVTIFSSANIKITKYKWYTSTLYTHPIKYNNKSKTDAGLAIENRMQLLQPLNKNFPQNLKPIIYLTNKEIEKANAYLIKSNINLLKPLFMISVLGSDKTKSYPIKFMAKVIDIIVNETKGQILFNYIPKQENDARAIYNTCEKHTQENIQFHIFGKNLREFLALTSHCNALIGNEGGAVNMAKALNIQTFTIFSPWIKKEIWSIFENKKTNVSVHLKDYMPNWFEKKSEKEIKHNSTILYNKFKPHFFEKKLRSFCSKAQYNKHG